VGHLAVECDQLYPLPLRAGLTRRPSARAETGVNAAAVAATAGAASSRNMLRTLGIVGGLDHVDLQVKALRPSAETVVFAKVTNTMSITIVFCQPLALTNPKMSNSPVMLDWSYNHALG